MRRQKYFLSLIFVGLGLFIIMPWWTSGTETPQVILDKKAPSLELVFQLPEHQKKNFHTIVQRPLFNPERRPVAETPILSSQESNRATISKLKIKGIVDNGRGKMVLVERNNKLIELNLGAELDGWILKKIDGRSVILSDGKTEMDLLKINQNAKKKTTSRNTKWLPKVRQNK